MEEETRGLVEGKGLSTDEPLLSSSLLSSRSPPRLSKLQSRTSVQRNHPSPDARGSQASHQVCVPFLFAARVNEGASGCRPRSFRKTDESPVVLSRSQRLTPRLSWYSSTVAANDSWGKVYTNGGASPMTQSLSILTGMSAGATESLIVTPFEGVKIRVSAHSPAITPPSKSLLFCVLGNL